MKIVNPFDHAEITVYNDGSVFIQLHTKVSVKVADEDAYDSFLLGSLKRLLTAEYVSVYPETKEEEEQ